MRVSIVAGLIVAVHVAVIGSVVLTQGCTTTDRGEVSTRPPVVEPAPPPVLPPLAPVATTPVTFPPILPPVEPAPVATEVASQNIYVVKAGDMLSKIAVAHGVRANELTELNKITDPNRIRVGQRLILPDYAQASKSPPAAKPAAAAAPAARPAPVGAGESYEIKPGDSLSKIATAHGVTVRALMEANQIADANRIRSGQKIVIPAKTAKPKAEAAPAAAVSPAEPKAEPAAPAAEERAAPVVAPAPTPAPAPAIPEDYDVEQEVMLNYRVQEGDTLESVARLFVVLEDELRRVNNLREGEALTPGNSIKIPPTQL